MKMKHSKIRIAIDALGIDRPGGARTATLYLFEKVICQKPDWEFIFFLSKKESKLIKDNVQQIVLPLRKGFFARSILQIILPIILTLKKANLIHFTKSQATLVPVKRKVITIFDMTTLHYPEQFSKLTVWYWQHIQKKMADACDAIIAISDNVARDIATTYAIDPERIHTIHLGTQFDDRKIEGSEDLQRVKRDYHLPERYMLNVGLLALKKNLEVLVRAIHLMKVRGTPLPPLILVGRRYSASDAAYILDLVHQLGLDAEVQYLGEVEPNDLRVIFRHALCLLLSSMHEGFGITALEALQLRVPLIASMAGALPEIIGDAGYLVSDYLDPEAWANAMYLVCEDEELRKKMITEGQLRASKFSWDRSAQNLVALYSQLLGIE